MDGEAPVAEVGYFYCSYKWIRCETLEVFALGARIVKSLEFCCTEHGVGHRILVPNSLWSPHDERDMDTQRFPSSHNWIIPGKKSG